MSGASLGDFADSVCKMFFPSLMRLLSSPVRMAQDANINIVNQPVYDK